MSAHMKKPPINKTRTSQDFLYILDDKKTMYVIPFNIAKKYIVNTCKAVKKNTNTNAEDIFKGMDSKNSKAGSLLKGLRARENLTQLEFAKIIGVTQANLSKMESGKRPIGKVIAKRIASAFDVHYKYFLE